MSDKKRTSISIDTDVYQFLKQSEINQSGLINELVKEYRDSDNRQLAALELRYEHMMAEAEDLQERADRKFEEAAEVKQLIEAAEDTRSDELAQAVKVVSNIQPRKRSVDNEAVQRWAEKVSMKPSELLEYVRSNT